MGARGRSIIHSDIRATAQHSAEQGRLREDSPALCNRCGEMSEKLRRCRKELAAALDRAFEDIVAPSFVSPQDYSIHVIQECQTSPSTSSPKIGQLIFGRSSNSLSSYVSQPLPMCYSKENVYPTQLANPIAGNVNRAPACPKRRPLASKENMLTNSSSHDCQPARASGESEKCKKLNTRKETDVYLKQEVSKPQNAYGQEITNDLLDIIEHTSIQTIEELTGKLEFENMLNKVCASPFKEEVLSLFAEDNCRNTTATAAKPEAPKAADDDNILETVLDLEEEYDLLPSVGQLLSS
ncbi:hypothetical protein NDU88_006558 [Pleurodeles waltl]|uniref:Uncharacterized protein n=1 Tax=Pleurodeles waltl TaxID=8319 RepID=A0AAV7N1P0_PLEWA|nr:hypothetical protein NDU88_006558 [Pleurodeles waltl]